MAILMPSSTAAQNNGRQLPYAPTPTGCLATAIPEVMVPVHACMRACVHARVCVFVWLYGRTDGHYYD